MSYFSVFFFPPPQLESSKGVLCLVLEEYQWALPGEWQGPSEPGLCCGSAVCPHCLPPSLQTLGPELFLLLWTGLRCPQISLAVSCLLFERGQWQDLPLLRCHLLKEGFSGHWFQPPPLACHLKEANDKICLCLDVICSKRVSVATGFSPGHGQALSARINWSHSFTWLAVHCLPLPGRMLFPWEHKIYFGCYCIQQTFT